MPVNEGKAPDGKGGVNQQFVDADGRAGVHALTETDPAHAVAKGLGYTLHSTYSATGGEEVISLKNVGANVFVDKVVVSTTVASVISVRRMTSGTPAGTDIKALARNGILGAAVMPDIEAFGNASVTGTVVGDIIDQQLVDPSIS